MPKQPLTQLKLTVNLPAETVALYRALQRRFPSRKDTVSAMINALAAQMQGDGVQVQGSYKEAPLSEPRDEGREVVINAGKNSYTVRVFYDSEGLPVPIFVNG